MPKAMGEHVVVNPRPRVATLVGLICAAGGVLAFWGAFDIVRHLYALQQSKLANPPRSGTLSITAAVLIGLAFSLGAAAWRVWREGSPHWTEAVRWPPVGVALWTLTVGFALAVNYPIPPQAHHTDKFLVAALVAFVWSAWFILRPASLSPFLTGRPFLWITVGMVNVIVFLAVAETVFRVADPLLARGGLFGDKQTPASLRPHAPVRGSIGATNSQGFRDRERAVERTGAGPRVVALGDSFTWGAGVTYDETFVTVLERGLQISEPGAEVINLGVPAWGPHEEFHLLKSYGARFKPDLVLLNFFIGNDIQNKRGEDTNLPEILVVAGQSYYVHSSGNWMHDKLGLDRWYLYHNLNYLIRVGASRLFHKGGLQGGEMAGEWVPLVSRTRYLKGIHERSDIFLRENTPFFDYHWHRTQETLRKIRDLLQSRQSREIPLLVILIPDHIQLDRALQNEYLAAFSLSSQGYDFEKPQRFLRAWCQQEGIDTIDLLPALQAESDVGALYFQNDIHWTVKGHALAAAAILPRLQELTRDRDGRRLAVVRQR